MENNKKTRLIGIGITLVVVVAIIVLTVLIITSSTPKKTIDGLFTNLKAGDFIKAKEFMVSENNSLDNILGDDFDQEAQKLLCNKMSWKINKINENGENATIEIEITNKDFKTIIGNYMQKMLKAAFGGKEIADEELEAELLNELKNDDVAMQTVTKLLTLKKEDSKWKVIVDEEFVNGILPGFQEAMNSLT